jgi:DAK2 domain fusion protein YloV
MPLLTQQITGALFRSMIINASAAIEKHKNEINELNVFPVPDGDTGTNMSLTISSGAKALSDAEPESVGRAAEITANSLLRGARGNSGVILSLLFRGTAHHLKEHMTATAAVFADALTDGVDAAYKAVMKPAEGTILTVSRLAAAAAVAAAETESDLEAVLARALEAGYAALADTINQNPVLKKAGVIDAGGKGYLYILDGMLKALRGEIIDAGAAAEPESRGAADFSDFDTGDIHFAYCTEFIVARETARDVNALRAFLDARGDSVVVVDDEEIIKVHVHSNEPGNILTEALTYGAFLSVKIDCMRVQHTEKLFAAQAAAPKPAAPEKLYGAVAVCAGDGMAEVFRDLGVDNLITGGQTMNPSTEDILAQIEATPSELVFVLPNNKNVVMAARECAPLTDKRVVVIPSKTIPQGVSALLAFDAALSEEENTEVMTRALENVRTAQITHAARDSNFDGRDIKEGEYLALLEDTLLVSGDDLAAVIDAVGRALAENEPEFITVFTGEDAEPSESEAVIAALTAAAPGAELTAVYGGQPVYRYLIAADCEKPPYRPGAEKADSPRPRTANADCQL